MKRVPVAYVNFVVFLKRVFIYAWILELNIILSIFFSFSCAQKTLLSKFDFHLRNKRSKKGLRVYCRSKTNFVFIFEIIWYRCTVWCITYNTLIHTVHSAVVEFIKEGVTRHGLFAGNQNGNFKTAGCKNIINSS